MLVSWSFDLKQYVHDLLTNPIYKKSEELFVVDEFMDER